MSMRLESLREILRHFPDIDGFWDLENPENTETRIRQQFPEGELPWTPSAVEALIQWARLLAFQDDFVKAKSTLVQAQNLIAGFDDVTRTRLEIRHLLEQGRLLVLQMTPMNAQTYFNQAWILSMKSGHVFFAIDAALMLSISQPPKFKKEWLQKGLQLGTATTDPQAKFWLPFLYSMVAWQDFDLHRYPEALESFENALKGPYLPSGQKMVYLVRWGLARTLRGLKENQKALDMQKELLTDLESQNRISGHVYLEIAECLQGLQRQDEAKSYFESAFKTLSSDKWFSDNKADELSRMQHLSKDRY